LVKSKKGTTEIKKGKGIKKKGATKKCDILKSVCYLWGVDVFDSSAIALPF
jgi:hypothetical protein